MAAQNVDSGILGQPAEVAPNGDTYNDSPQNGTLSHPYLAFDNRILASSINDSPGSAKRILEAHIADTDRRIRDASRLGTNLLEQKKLLAERLGEVEQNKGSTEIDPELRQKLDEVEREYVELGKETARISLINKTRKIGTSIDAPEGVVLAGDAGESPTKTSALTGASSRKQRNTSSRVEDLAFATEISTSLLGQVRQLQNALAEKEEALRKTNNNYASLQSESDHTQLRLKSVLDNEQRYKDENWHLETQVQELSTQVKEILSREQKTNLNLSNLKREKSTAERDFDDLRMSHGKLTDEHNLLRKKHDTEVANLRRSIASSGFDRDIMQKKNLDLTTQNEELARAVAYRIKTEGSVQSSGTFLDEDDSQREESTLDPSPPPSPTKGTPRHGALESETLKSSLHHAHRMIQNLKNNIHREKTEKVELRRMLQDARDEVESSRAERAVGAGKRKKQTSQRDLFKKPARPDKLGSRSETSEEIINDPSWEEAEDSPSARGATRAESSTDASDAFETATENDPSTESDAFLTAESVVGDESEGDATETETSNNLPRPSGLRSTAAGSRNSFLSTASSDEEGYDLTTPPRNNTLRRPLRMGSRGGLRQASSNAGVRDSPASFVSNSSQATPKQDLAAELEDFDDETSQAVSTPSRSIHSNVSSPPDEGKRDTRILISERLGLSQPQMMDSGTSTEPWNTTPSSSADHLALGVAGGSLLGAGLGAMFGFSSLVSQHTTPIAPKKSLLVKGPSISAAAFSGTQEMPGSFKSGSDSLVPAELSLSGIVSQHTHPIQPSLSTSMKETSFAVPTSFPSLPIEGEARAASPLASMRRPLDTPSIAVVDGIVKDTSGTMYTPASQASSLPLAESQTALHVGGRKANGLEDVFVDRNELRRDLSRSPPEVEIAMQGPRSTTTGPQEDKRAPFQAVSGNSSARNLSTADKSDRDGIGYAMSTNEAEQAYKDKGKGPLLVATAFNSIESPSGSARSKQLAGPSPPPVFAPTRSPNRPGSAGSLRTRGTSPAPANVPPLPLDHKEAIAAASRTSSLVNVPPPQFPASATKSVVRKASGTFRGTSPSRIASSGAPTIARSTSSRPPSITTITNRPPSITANTNRPPSVSANTNRPPSISANINRPPSFTTNTTRAADAASMGRRSSISSFASDIDDRFHRQAIAQSYSGFDMGSTTDPRMIQAITQTMIGEFMWKYTRKTGRGSSHSENRHKRFFWIHPYTRTLYWSVQDPSRSGHGFGGARQELKAKSVPIEAVRVVSDENPHPPGLCNKSIVVVTPSRSIKFTAPTSLRHETWFNALSYLLLRNGNTERAQDTSNQAANFSSMRSSISRSGAVAAASGRTSTTAVNSLRNYTDASPSVDRSNTLGSLTSEDISEFNPTLRPRPGSRQSNTNPGSYRPYSSVGHRASSSLLNRGSMVPSTPAKSSQAQSQPGSLAARQSIGPSASGSMVKSTSATPTRASIAAFATSTEGSTPEAGPSTTTSYTPPNQQRIDGEVDADGFRKPAVPVRNMQRTDSVRGSLTSRSRAAMGSLFRARSRSRGQEPGVGEEVSHSGEGSAAESQETLAAEGHTHTHVRNSNSTSGTVENVRACCDGKHDVGHLSHRNRHASLSLGGRNSSNSGHLPKS